MGDKGRSRIRSFDISKCIGMLCIMAGHLGISEVNEVVFTFHVPLFFLISGCLYRKPTNGAQALRKRVTRLLVPYVTCAVLCCVGVGIRKALMGYAKQSWIGVASEFLSALYGSGSPKSPGGIASFGAIWFLLALFCALAFYDAICDKKWVTLAACGLFAIGVATKKWWLPFSIQPGMCGVLFLHFGHVAKERFPESVGKGRVPHVVGVAALAVWLIKLLCFRGHLSMVRCFFPCIPLDLIAAIAGTLFILWLSGLIDRIPVVSDGLSFYGRNTLTALCFHMFDLNVIPWKSLIDPAKTMDYWTMKSLVFVIKVAWSIIGVVLVDWIRRMRARSSDRQNAASGRIRSYDIAKGVVILLVVATHQAHMDPVFRRLVFSFHMPFFFLVNAVFIAGCYDVGRTFRRSLRTLVLPYVVVCLLEALLKGLVTIENTKISVLHRLQAMLVGMSFTGDVFTGYLSVSLVWFVACLFVARNVYVLSRRLTDRCHPYVPYLVAIALCAFGWWLGSQNLYLPWSADVALFAQVFMLVGDEVGKYRLLEKKPAVAVVLLVAAVWVALATGGFQIEMAMRKYPGFAVCMVGACAGSLIVYWASAFLDVHGCSSPGAIIGNLAADVLVWIGRNSIVILAIHCLRRLWAGWTSGGRSFDTTLDWIGNAFVEILFCIAVCFVYDRAKDCLREMRTGVALGKQV